MFKGLFKYYISRFSQILDDPPPKHTDVLLERSPTVAIIESKKGHLWSPILMLSLALGRWGIWKTTLPARRSSAIEAISVTWRSPIFLLLNVLNQLYKLLVCSYQSFLASRTRPWTRPPSCGRCTRWTCWCGCPGWRRKGSWSQSTVKIYPGKFLQGWDCQGGQFRLIRSIAGN